MRYISYTALAVGLVLTACSIVPLATPEFLAHLGEFEMVKCETLMIRNKSETVTIGVYSENDGGIAILSSENNSPSAFAITMGENGYKLGLVDEGKDKVVIGVNDYGDGVIMLFDRNGNQTLLGLPVPE